jgi:hypothetical protein
MADAVPLDLTLATDEVSQLPVVGEAPTVAAEGEILQEVGGEVETEEVPDFNEIFELGDFVRIDSVAHGKVIGYIYYRDGTLISVMPVGATDILYDFPRIFDDENDKFDDDLGVTESYIIEKRKLPTFVEQQDFHVGQVLETITADRQKGENLTITAINDEDDNITVIDPTGKEETIEFSFTGIPRDSEFKILRIVEQPKEIKVDGAEQVLEETTVQPEGEVQLDDEDEVEQATQELNEQYFDIEVVGEITVKKSAVYKEAKTSEKTYTDTIQKADAMSDFLNLLDPVAQKDPKQVRAVRILVETLFNLKQQTVEYNEDGSVKGEQKVSVNLLKDLLSSTNVPISRPVLDIALRIFLKDDEKSEFQLNESNEFFKADNIIDTIEKFTAVNVNPVVSAADSTNIFRTGQKNFVKQFETVWKPNGLAPPLFHTRKDSEFFRHKIPDLNETIHALTASKPAKDEPSSASETTVTQSIRRAVAPTYYKQSSTGRKEQLVSGDVAPVTAHVLFPMDTATTVGSKRSGLLAIDSARSQGSTKLMKDIIEEKDGVVLLGKEKEGEEEEAATVDKILALDMTGVQPSTFLIRDYLEGITMPATGLGDMHIHLEELGLTNLELNPEIMTVLESKISGYQNQLLASLARFRELLASNPETPQEDNSFLENPEILETVIRSEPILLDSIIELENQTPGIKPSDLAQVSYLLRKHNDYFQAAMGQQAFYVAKERFRATRDRFLAAVELSRLLAKKKLQAGIPPKPNKCEHVAKLAAIRKIDDDQERMQALAKLFSIYQGQTDNDFINCNICKRELVCMHERLQISAFLNPQDSANIQKEITLKFANGQFQGAYICKNCGQPITEIEFDTNLEYDDNGKPMMGRAVLVDTDAIIEEQLDFMLKGITIREEKKMKFKSKTEENYRDIIFELANRIGISLQETTLRKMVERLVRLTKTLDSQEEYERKFETAKKEGKQILDYVIAINRRIIAAAAAILLIEIQTRVPEYTAKYALFGCKPSFEGFPLGEPTNKDAFNYLACAVASVTNKIEPWTFTKWQEEPNVNNRIQSILAFMNEVFKRLSNSDQVISQELIAKRAYLESRAKDKEDPRRIEKIPEGFLPLQKDTEVIVPEVAARMKDGTSQVARAWIRAANALAAKTAIIVKGSPYQLTTCCVGNISIPGAFWLSASDLPELGVRKMKPNYRVQGLWIHFTPRPLASIAVEHDDNLNYRLFLKVCYQGPNKGKMHEVGLTNKCRWCGFQFPANPAIVDADSEFSAQSAENTLSTGITESSDGRTAVSSQGIDTGREVFEDLLDQVHMNNKVEPYKVHLAENLDTVMEKFINITPPLFNNWLSVMTKAIEDLKLATQTGKKSDLENAVGEISRIAADAKLKLKMRLAKVAAQVEKLGELSWDNLLSTILSYFVVPFRRILTDYQSESQFSVFSKKKKWSLYSDFGDLHIEDLTTILNNEDVNFKKYKQDLKDKARFKVALLKMNLFVERASELLSFKESIHPGIFPGREYSLKWIQKAIVYSMLRDLVDPNVQAYTPEGGIASEQGQSTSILMNMVADSLIKFDKEQLAYNDEELREKIQIRNEKEKADIISMFDKMSEEEKVIEQYKKQLGIGRWAVGGTKAIWGYDIEQYEREREERARAGIIDFPGYGPNDVPELAGRQLDAFGYPVHGAEDGYDHVQTGADDA